MRIILLAAGEASRWGHYLAVPKHLVPINGEPILHRTVRLVRDLHPDAEVHIAARPEDLRDYTVPGAITFEADLNPARFDADKFLSSRRHWAPQGDTLLLYGDVFYTRDALATILGTPVQDWLLFARFSASRITGSRWPEPFAFRIAQHFQDEFAHVGQQLIERYLARQLHRIGGWEFYAMLTGSDLSCPGKFAGSAVVIDDWTEDFDHPYEFDAWCQRMIMGGHFDVL